MESCDGGSGVQPADLDRLPVEEVAIDDLRIADSPRIAGEDHDHIADLAGIYERLPPVLVHRLSMRVIDGMHRLRAARERGETHVRVRFVEGDEASVFVLAVRTNVSHGMPLSPDDKKAAAIRIMDLYPDWSDRRISSVCGVSAKTIAALRRRPTGARQQLDKRVGRDGKARPVDSAERQEKVKELLRDKPEAPLREIAQEADVSPETVRKLRTVIREEHMEEGRAVARIPRQSDRHDPGPGRGGLPTAFQKLKNDPAIRSNEVGRQLLQVLGTSAVLMRDPEKVTGNLPEYALPWIAEAARYSAGELQTLADMLVESNS